MPKTRTITVDCKRIEISPCTHLCIRVTFDEPDLNHIFEDIVQDDLAGYVQNEYTPDDLFTEKQLGKWAEENGYTKI